MTDEELRQAIWEALHDVHDPEVGLDIVNMGLVYEIKLDAGTVDVVMTLTSPSCPAGERIVEGVYRRVMRVPGVTEVFVPVTFEPPWSPAKISEAGRAQLGW